MKANVLLQGDIGTGKTTSLRTLLPEYTDNNNKTHKGAGQISLLLSNEPGAEAALGKNLCQSKDSFGIHIKYVQPLSITWGQFGQFMQIINTHALETALKMTDPNKIRCTQFLEMMGSLQEFICDRCGRNFGDVAELDLDTRDTPEWARHTIAYDSLTGLTTIARHLCVGLKPILSQPEYNPVMGAVEGFLQLFFGSTACNTVLLSHIDREINPITGISGITVHTIGQKLAPRIVKMPDEIITATYSDGDYAWNTELPGQILKVRRMPRDIGLAPDFSQLFKDAT